MKRGLTLIEVVAATALLSLVVLACVPLLAGARRDLSGSPAAEPGAVGEFAWAVDELLRQAPGLIHMVLERPSGLRQRWMVGDREYEAEVRLGAEQVAVDEERRSSHAWVIFESRGVELPRWLRLPTQLEGGSGT